MTARNLPPNSQEISIVEAARLVLRAQGIASGLWHVGLRMHFATTQAESASAGVLPAGVVAVEGLVLTPVGDSGTLAVATPGAGSAALEGVAETAPAPASQARQPPPGPQAAKPAKPAKPAKLARSAQALGSTTVRSSGAGK